ncbi:MAG: hypothetical protein CFE21_16935 [Bacteroidetes bacterium B1(2017)]|nr:MAG: hypothetical protein CFE21_16935 [Bacteroidetes bacterium B1(2017)]
MDVFCIGLIFSRDQYRYRSYATEYVEALLRLQKQVAIFSPNWIELNNLVHTKFRDQGKLIHCFPIDATHEEDEKPGTAGMTYRYLMLSRRLHQAERSMQTKIDFVLFAPVDDWIKPRFGRKLMDWSFPFKWSGILTHMMPYEETGLKRNVDPKFGEVDYLFTSENCVGVCTLDRFRSEALKSRVYKKVVVMPDVSELRLPKEPQKISAQVKKMARDRMVVGTILLENENPENFLNLANMAPSDQYFFVCAGRIEPEQLNDNCKQALNQLLSSGKNNNYFILHQLEDSESINDLLLTFDVCYLNDGDFQLPHPLLTKAAFFHKPVVGSRNDMIGKLLSAFKTGITVNGKVGESVSALSTLRLQMPFDKNFDLGRLRNYAQLQNQDALRDALEMILQF